MTTSDPRPARDAGFTLLEVVVVLAVLSLLVGAAVPLASAVLESDRRAEARSELAAIAQALEGYFQDRGTFPASLGQSDFAGVHLQPGVNGTTLVDPFARGAQYRYAVDAVALTATVHSVGEDGVDAGVANEDLVVVVHGAVPGLRRTRARMRVIVEALANFLEAGGAPTGVWATDRAALGLGVEYATDGFGTAFTLDPATLTLRSAGPDRIHGTADDVTT